MKRPSFKLLPLMMMAASLQLLPQLATARTDVPVAEFKSVALKNGGEVTIRYGLQQRVTLLEGTIEQTRMTVEDGRLIIDRCQECDHDSKMVVEITTPDFEDLLVTDGGTIATAGSFPARKNLRAAVEDGGTIDVRSVASQSVAALVESGGRIFTTAEKSLLGSIAHGGMITYWGACDVTSTVDDGGMVTRGKPEQSDAPLEDLSPGRSIVPPVPMVAPMAPLAPTTTVKKRTSI